MGLEQIENAIAFIRQNGPVLPIQLTKILGGNTMLSGAVLSQLVSERKIRLSHAKIGGSSVYYMEGQEVKLEMLFQYLNEKDKQTYDILHKQKILHDSDQTTLIRFSLRQLKDFAKPLEVTYGEHTELFWKWYLISDEEATELIRAYIATVFPQIQDAKGESGKEEKKQEIKKDVKDELKKEIRSELKSEIRQEIKPEVKPNFKSELKSELKSDFKSNIKPDLKLEPKNHFMQDVKRMVNVEGKKENIKESIKENINQHVKEQVKEQVKEHSGENVKDNVKESQMSMASVNIADIKDSFLQEVSSFFKKKNITIQSFTQIKAASECDFIILLPTAIGPVQYFCKAKNKKKIAESDIHEVFTQGQMKKLPVLLLSYGELTKKAKELLEKELKSITALDLS